MKNEMNYSGLESTGSQSTGSQSTGSKSSALKCARFQLEKFIAVCIMFVLIYYAIILLGFTLNYFLGGHSSGTANMFFIPCCFFIFFSLSSMYKQNFNHLLMMSNTRKNILGSFFISTAVTALLFAAFSLISQLIDKALSYLFVIPQIDILSGLYKNINYFSDFVWVFSTLLLVSAFAMLYGSLRYKFGKKFVIIFWVLFGLSFNLIPIVIELKLVPFMINIFTMFFSLNNENGIYFSSLNFTILAIIFGIATYLIGRRQAQRA
jgi:hypothetical protein